MLSNYYIQYNTRHSIVLCLLLYLLESYQTICPNFETIRMVTLYCAHRFYNIHTDNHGHCPPVTFK